jgi:hypothetical protein
VIYQIQYRHEAAHFSESCFVFGLVFFGPLDFALALDCILVWGFPFPPRPSLDFFLKDRDDTGDKETKEK